MGRDLSIIQFGESPQRFGVHSNLGTNTYAQRNHILRITLAARGLEEHVRITLIFFENHPFHVIYWVTLAYVLFSKNF